MDNRSNIFQGATVVYALCRAGEGSLAELGKAPLRASSTERSGQMSETMRDDDRRMPRRIISPSLRRCPAPRDDETMNPNPRTRARARNQQELGLMVRQRSVISLCGR